MLASVIALAVIGAFASMAIARGNEPAFRVLSMDGVDQITVNRIGRLDPIIVRFTEPMTRPEALADAIKMRPQIKGEWTVADERTIRFTPQVPYKPRARITRTCDTSLLSGLGKGLKGFVARFTVKADSVTMVPSGLYPDPNGADSFILEGTVVSGIPIGLDEAKRDVKAKITTKRRERGVDIVWTDKTNATSHAFKIVNIPRASEDSILTLSWKDASRGSSLQQKSWLVPKKDDFRVMDISQEGQSSVKVRFSELLDPHQDARGFVRVGMEHNVRYSINKNELTVFGKEAWVADQQIEILEGLKSEKGKTLAVPVSATINTEWEKPSVKFATDGVILPTTDGVIIPIETMNLSGVLIQAYKIYADNVLQFLQVNELDGSRELKRVGEPVWTKSFDLPWNDGMKNRFVPRGLDVTELVKKDPAAMLQIKISFRPRHSKYVCNRNHGDFSNLPQPPETITLSEDGEQRSWDYAEDMDYEERNSYYSYNDDPCHPAYYLPEYHQSSVISRNLLVSNLGILVKKEASGALAVTVADIGTTNPVQGAEVTFYSYAQGKLLSGSTNQAGTFRGMTSTPTYFITASKGGKTSYLRVDDGTSLSVSHFQVDGVSAESGIKGFIYGERGVWRPGDDIHLMFILQDLTASVPKNFPITFELEDPQGRVQSTEVIDSSVGGFYRIDAATADDDPSGSWTARVSAGSQTWTKSLRIEAIVPNRLSIDLKADKKSLSSGDNRFTLKSAWLHGAPAPNYKADVWVGFLPGTTAFDGYADYTFTDPRRSVEEGNNVAWEGSLNGDSSADFSIYLEPGSPVPGIIKAMLTTRVFEPSDMFSVEQSAYTFSPYDRYVGVKLPKGDAARGMLLTDVQHRVDLAVVDAEGRPARGNVELSMSVYKLEWKWWWEKDALTDATYVSHSYERIVSNERVVAKNGIASWTMEVKYPEWGRYLVVAEDGQGGHSTGKIVYIDWPGWAGRGGEAGTGSAAMLPLSRDKESYRVGETASITFASNGQSRALITLEKAGSIIKQEWIATSRGTTVWKCPVTASMTPNVYAHITVLQPHMQTANSLPIRLYGVIPLMVEDPATRLTPTILAPAEYAPGTASRVKVSEAAGKPMTYTLAVVDEGLLGLTKYSAPNPWREFYQKEASSLASWDIYRYVMSAYGGKLETLLSVGGSEDLLGGNQGKTQRFKPVVIFLGPFELGPGEVKEHSFQMPNYIGAVRLMVVAGKQGAYGVAEKQVPVREKLMILSTLPRTLGTNEKIEIPVTVFNGQPVKAALKVTLKSEGALVANASVDVVIDASSDKTVTFPVSTALAGKARLSVEARSIEGDISATHSSEIDVASRGSATSTVRSFSLKPGDTYRDFVPSPGEKGSLKMFVELSKMTALDIHSRLAYLTGYPHGCIEQITSGAFPQLYLPSMVDLSAEETERVKRNVMSVIDRYPSYQSTQGGFAYWPSAGEPNPWGTNYAGHFMIEARRAGYEVPDSLYKPWLEFQQAQAKAFAAAAPEALEAQAYRLFTLALSGNADIGSMNRLRQQSGLTPAASWLLAGSYYTSGQRAQGAELARTLKLPSGDYRDTGNNWGSSARDQALALTMLNLLGEPARALDAIDQVATRFASGSWYSTQETAWTFIALAPHYSQTKATNAAWKVEWDKGELEGVVTKGTTIRELEPFESPTQTVVCKNVGTEPLFAKIVTRGILPAGQEKALDMGVQARVRYVNAEGRDLNAKDLLVGDTFDVVVQCKNTLGRKIDNLALSVPIPTCWEFANERVGMEGKEGVSPSQYDWKDIRDTHVYTYFSLKPSETKTFRYTATVVYGGSYYVPAVRLEAMYDGEIASVVPGAFVTSARPARRN